MFLSIELQSYGQYIFQYYIEIWNYLLQWGLHISQEIPCLFAAIIPIKSYSNAEADKDKIFKENKDKSGIYKLTNLTNNKCYIGSAIDLSDRLSFYFSKKALTNSLQKSKSSIYNALLKYDYSNFSFTIIEYCSPEQCIERENYYLSSEKHEYNICQKAGSPLGRKHYDETKKILSEANTGEKNSMFGKTGENHPNYGQKVEGSGKASQQIEVTDIKNDTTISYNSISEAAKALNIKHTRIVMYFSRNQTKPYKGQYTFKKLN